MAVLSPQRQSIKPPCGSRINWGHPLSVGLAGAWVFNEAAGLTYNDGIRNSSGLMGAAASGGSGSPVWVPTSAGMGVQTTQANKHYLEAFDPSAFVAPNDLTVCWYGIKNAATTGGSFQNIFALTKWNTGAQPGTNEWILLIGNGITGTGENIQFNCEMGSTAHVVDGGQVITIGKLAHVVGVRRGTTNYTYLDGVEGTTVTTGVTGTINNFGRKVRIAWDDDQRSSGSWVFTSCTTVMAVVWNRALSPLEIKQHAADPYCMFQPVVQPGRPPFISTAIGITPGTLTPRFVFFETGEYHLGA